MTGKVKIPFEIADAINYLKSESYSKSDIIRTALRANWCNEPDENDVNIEILNGMDAEKLVLAVHGHCEVEPKYKVGDWVAFEKVIGEAFVGKIEGFEEGGFLRTDIYGETEVKQWFVASGLRHATPEEIKAEKERRVWKKIGREVGEFRDGDIGITNGGAESKINHPNNIKLIYKDGCLKGFYPAESFVSFEEADFNA